MVRMASSSTNDVVIVKVENGRITKRPSTTLSQPAESKRRKSLVELSSSTEVQTEELLTKDHYLNSSVGNEDVSVIECGKGKSSAKTHNDANNSTVLIDTPAGVVELLQNGQDGALSPEDVALLDQQMLDHALALSIEQDELEKLSRDYLISNVGELPTNSITSSSSKTSLTSTTGQASCSKLNNESVPMGSGTTLLPAITLGQQHVSPSVDSLHKDCELPEHWQTMPENLTKSYELFMVLPGTEEYNTVTHCFVRQPLLVYSVKRIQNLELLKRYSLEKELLLSVRVKGFCLNEQNLFHTSAANPDDICEQGLDNRLSRHGGSFGAGIYFSDDVLKCHSYWRHSFQPALMFQCRVILGDIKEYPRGQRDVQLRREPEKLTRNPGEHRTYDSVKGNVTGRNEFVVYNAYRVMPEYMIEYTFTSTSSVRMRGLPTLPVTPPAPIQAAGASPTTDPRYLDILRTIQKKGRGRGRGGKR